jgi:hypothetical protein
LVLLASALAEASAVYLAKANPLIPPFIWVNSPQNKVYAANEVQLNFRTLTDVYSNSNFSSFACSLDGQESAPIVGNTTLTGLSYGSHTLVVYGTDTNGLTHASEVIHFHIFFNTLWAATAVFLLAVATIGIVIFIKKRQHITAVMKRKKPMKFWLGLVVFSLASFLVFATVLFWLDYSYYSTHSGLSTQPMFFLIFIVVGFMCVVAALYWMKSGLNKNRQSP